MLTQRSLAVAFMRLLYEAIDILFAVLITKDKTLTF